MKKLFIALLMCIFMVGLISGAPPFQQFEGTQGLIIGAPPITEVRAGETVNFEFHIINASNGMPIITKTSCYLHIYNRTGNHIVEAIALAPSHTFDYGFKVNGTNFTNIGYYSYKASCNNTDGLGGLVSNLFMVSDNGFTQDGILTIFFLILFLIIVIADFVILMVTLYYAISTNMDIKDVVLNLSFYFGLFAYYILATKFLGNFFIEDFCLLLIEIGAVTNVIIPIIMLVVSFFKQNLNIKDHN